MDIKTAIQVIEDSVENPRVALPEEIFYLISRLTAMINVDLLIKDKDNQVLLSWRDTEFSGAGWHIPGGIIRYKESLEDRIQKVALSEVGCKVHFDPNPLAITQIEKHHATRGHFLSILYRCYLPDDFNLNNGKKQETDPGYLQWHSTCPENIVKVHDVIYKQVINNANMEYFSGKILYEYIENE